MSDINVSASIDAGKNITALLEKLAAQIGQSVDKVWPWLVRQQVIEGWTNLALCGLFLVLGAALFLWGAHLCRKNNGDDDWRFALLLAGGGVLLISLFVIAVSFSANITKIINPEYAALQELVRMVKP